MADLNPIRFSTKYTDPESSLLYYGYRYYNPSTGRWMNRDPMGESGSLSLYCSMANDVVGRVDVLGLTTARAKVYRSIYNIFQRMEGYQTVHTTAYLRAIGWYRGLLPVLEIEDAVLVGKFAKYYPYDNRLVVDRYAVTIPADTVGHELAHAYNDIVLGLSMWRDDEMDEGMGYAMEAFAGVAERLRDMEFKVLTRSCADSYTAVVNDWPGFWRSYGSFPGNWGTVRWGFFGRQRYLNVGDLQNLSRYHGVRLSCRAVATALNDRLADRGCCWVVSCDRDSAAGVIGTLYEIDPFFK
jgi:RHS repeat-associated protein